MPGSDPTAITHEADAIPGATATPSPVGAERDRSGSPCSPLATSVAATLARSGRWTQWQEREPRLTGFASLEEALEGWRRRDERCYQVVAGLTALGARRGGDDDDAALAAVVLLEEGVTRVAATLRDVCEIDDVTAAVWEEVKNAEPQLGRRAARYLLQRARQRLTRPAAGMVTRGDTTSLDQRLGWEGTWAGGSGGTARPTSTPHDQDRDIAVAVAPVEDPVDDLIDLLNWARGVGVVADSEVELLVELLAADHDGMGREDAQQEVGRRHGVAMRTVRRRRDATVARLRAAAPQYVAATS